VSVSFERKSPKGSEPIYCLIGCTTIIGVHMKYLPVVLIIFATILQSTTIKSYVRIINNGRPKPIENRNINLPNSKNNKGQLDRSFGEAGIVVYSSPFSEGDSLFNSPIQFNAVAQQVDGKLVAVGTIGIGSNHTAIVIVRFDSSGIVDSSFGNSGIAKIDWEPWTNFPAGRALKIQEDGKIIVVGTGSYDEQDQRTNFTVIRLNADGSLDPTFGTDGEVSTEISIWDYANAITLQTDEKILVAGSAHNAASGESRSDFVIVRYNSDGSLDQSFGVNGMAITDVSGLVGVGSGRNDAANAIALSDRGEIVVVGHSDLASNIGAFAIVKYDSNGTLDSEFGSGGIVTHNFDSQDFPRASANSVLIQPNGAIIVAGYTELFGSKTDFAVIRLSQDGSLDLNFGEGGMLTVDLDGFRPYEMNDEDRAFCVVAQPSDGFLVVGSGVINLDLSTTSPTGRDVALVSIDNNGALVSDFGNNGIVLTDTGFMTCPHSLDHS